LCLKTQFVITLGSRSKSPTAKKGWQAGRFDEDDYTIINNTVRGSGFPGSTVARVKGFWNGQEEDSVQITILADSKKKVEGVARLLRATFKQQSVLLSTTGSGEFFEGKVDGL